MPVTIKIRICQVDNNSDTVFDTIKTQVEGCIEDKVDMIVLPECFSTPYDMKLFPEVAEEKGSSSKTYKFLSNLAKHGNAYVIGGSFITKEDDKYYNTCYVFDRTGKEIGCYDKMHLFDIDLPVKKYRESDVLTAGKSPLIVDTEFGKIGIGICFDLRFQEMAKYYRDNGCVAIVYPGAFTVPTGAIHYELLLRSRALDNQCLIVGCAPARNEKASYVTWSNSTIVNPWGIVVCNLGHSECSKDYSYVLDYTEQCRKNIPLKLHDKFSQQNLYL